MRQPAKRLLSQIYIQVLIGVLLGIALGVLLPELAASLKPIADGFIKLIKMLLAPIVFGTVVVGIARMGDLKDVGRIGVKALVYFEVLSTIALVIGLIVVNVLEPGAGMNIDPSTVDGTAIVGYTAAAREQGVAAFLLDIIPSTLLDAFVQGAMLQVILVSVLIGVALSHLGERGRPLVDFIDAFLQVMFQIVGIVMRLAPLGAGAGIAYTIGTYGIDTIWSLARLMLALYATSIVFVVVVLGQIMRAAGLPFFAFLKYLREEIFIVFGTCSTEAVLPQLMRKLEELGCARPVVGMVLPAGYTFNADGTCIYLTIATVFIAQATNTPLGWTDQLVVLAVLMLTSKGSAGVAGAGFIALAATLSTMDAIPVAGLVLLLGVDRFLNEARAVTNLIGNSVATVAIAKWDHALDLARAREVLGERKPREREPTTLSVGESSRGISE